MPKKTVKKVASKPVVKVKSVLKQEKSKPMSWGIKAFLHSLGVVAYIIFISFLLVNGDKLFGSLTNSILGPIVYLLLLTLSAALVGLLIFGRPVMLYLDGKKKEAMEFVAATVGFLFAEALIVFILLALLSA